MNLLTWLVLAAYLAMSAWCASLVWREREALLRPVWALLGLGAAASAAWAWGLSADPQPGLAAGSSWPVLWDGLRQLAWTALLVRLLGLSRARQAHWRALRWVVPGLLVLAGLAMTGAEMRWFPRRWSELLPAYANLAMAVMGLVLLEQLYRNAGEDRRWNVKPLCLGLAAGYGFDLYLYSQGVLLGGLDAQASALRPVVHALGLPLLLLGTLRGAGLAGRIGLSRDAAFHSAALLLAGAYLLLVALLGYWLRFTGGEWGGALQMLLAAGAALVLGVMLMSGALRARLRVWLAKHFLRYRYDYRVEWLRFTTALSDGASQGDPASAVVRALANLVESPGGGLWCPAGERFRQVADWNFERAAWQERLDSDFIRAMVDKGWIVDLNAERERPSGAVCVSAALLLDRDAWLVVPLVAGGSLQGWVVLVQPRSPFPVNWEVLDLLRSAASQAAGFLAMRQATEQLLEARKFEAFNRMSAFVVHDLKNIVSQLSLMMRNADRHGDKPEFRRDMNETIENALDKMRQLMTQLREGEPGAVGSGGVSLAAIAERLRDATAQRGRVLLLEVQEPLSTRGHEARVERVIGHAVQNALDASAEVQPVRLSLERLGSYAKLQVIDQGCGMSAEFVRERLFKPFQSTKAHGMGIGAYESLQYVQELGGKLEVESEPGLGTCVTFLLPLLHTQSSPAQP
jgi:putative PEP-CTERM system histidine kinase